MKFIEKMSLVIFSIIILFLSLTVCLLIFNWMDVFNIYFILQKMLENPTASNISLVVSIILMLLSIKCIFFYSDKSKEEKAEGVLLANESGKLLISIDTIENLVKGVVAGFPNVKSTNCKVKLDKQVNNVTIDMNLVVSPDTIIKELSVNMQNKIKEVIKNTIEIDVKQINIRIKNIEPQKDKKAEG